MYRNITLIQIADELKLRDNDLLKRYFQPGARKGDRPLIEWINGDDGMAQQQVAFIIDMQINRILGLQKSQAVPNPEILPNLLRLRECVGYPTKTASDYLLAATGPISEGAALLAKTIDATLAKSSLIQEYIRANVLTPRQAIVPGNSTIERTIPNYVMTALPDNSTSIFPVPKEEVGEAIEELIANVRAFHQLELELGRSPHVLLSEKACFLLSNNESELAYEMELMPKDVALIVDEYLTNPKLKIEQSPNKLRAKEACSLLSKESELATLGIFGKKGVKSEEQVALIVEEYLSGPKSVS